MDRQKERRSIQKALNFDWAKFIKDITSLFIFREGSSRKCRSLI